MVSEPAVQTASTSERVRVTPVFTAISSSRWSLMLSKSVSPSSRREIRAL